VNRGTFVDGRQIACNVNGSREEVVDVGELSEVLPGEFNLHNALPAVAVARLFGVDKVSIGAGIRNFKPEEHRFDRVGTFRGITFYNASIATVPEVTIEHLKALGPDVQTMLLGGFDRGMDFGLLARHILESEVRTVILFPETGRRIWEAITSQAASTDLPRACFIDKTAGAERAMREAITLAYLHTVPGKICLHSPASPSFGAFRNYKERGELFKRFVAELSESAPQNP
jgi:UDP-N-acetylmuramoylalanine--D-glutamate ligase